MKVDVFNGGRVNIVMLNFYKVFCIFFENGFVMGMCCIFNELLFEFYE